MLDIKVHEKSDNTYNIIVKHESDYIATYNLFISHLEKNKLICDLLQFKKGIMINNAIVNITFDEGIPCLIINMGHNCKLKFMRENLDKFVDELLLALGPIKEYHVCLDDYYLVPQIKDNIIGIHYFNFNKNQYGEEYIDLSDLFIGDNNDNPDLTESDLISLIKNIFDSYKECKPFEYKTIRYDGNKLEFVSNTMGLCYFTKANKICEFFERIISSINKL